MLDNISSKNTDISPVVNAIDNSVVFSPEEYNRCLIIYNNVTDIYYNNDNNLLKVLRNDRLSSLLDAIGGKWKIRLCTEEEMMVSHCFDKRPEDTKRLQLKIWTHNKPAGNILVILFNINRNIKFNRAVRLICNLYAIFYNSLNINRKTTCLMYSQYEEDHPDKYRLCCDDWSFIKHAYDVMSGLFNESDINEEMMSDSLGGAITGDFGSVTLPESLAAIQRRYKRLNKLHKKDKIFINSPIDY